jgi:hypothetical protein
MRKTMLNIKLAAIMQIFPLHNPKLTHQISPASVDVCAWLCIVAACTYAQQQYHGILINCGDGNGYAGTQLYDPFNSPNAHGNLSLGLKTDYRAYGGGAVTDGPLAYFAAGYIGTHVYH